MIQRKTSGWKISFFPKNRPPGGGAAMKGTILCYGDSNTYGYDPQSPLGGRYPPQVRWPDQLAALQPDRQIVNLGENGREIPRRPWEVQRLEEALKRSSPVDAVVILLGSNDLLQMSP